MKKLWYLLLFVFVIGIFSSCTENQRAKNWGGTADVNLQPNMKLVNATWKDDNLWILVRDMKQNEQPETYHFYEKSSWGILEGAYIIREQKK